MYIYIYILCVDIYVYIYIYTYQSQPNPPIPSQKIAISHQLPLRLRSPDRLSVEIHLQGKSDVLNVWQGS